MNKKSIDELLDDISVMPPEHLDQPQSTKDWHAVTTTDGIIAYFMRESDAFRFRLDYINGILNPSQPK